MVGCSQGGVLDLWCVGFGAESRGVPKEMLLQVGMIGDFIMEVNRVVRQCDADDLDEAELPSILGDCEQILHHMFVEGQCMHCPCLTTSMVSMLSDPHTYIVDGHPKTIGSSSGVPADVVTRCMTRMAAMTGLASTVIKAEFPDLELLASFKAFNLGSKAMSAMKTVPKECGILLDRLACALQLDKLELRAQFLRFQPLACNAFKLGGYTLFEAWRHAILPTQKRMSSRERYPAEAHD